MGLSMEYVQPVTEWLKHHSDWSLLLTFIISFGESLAIIGSIVPGSVMMTMIGILAGTGVMRIDLTLIAAILGAIAGDGGSYLLGYYYSDKLLNIWPFKKHPQWLEYGKTYFIRHGGKSVFFGRFIGPLRSIIPVIAGMMQMKQLEFLVANSISAVAWSIVYVGPGILIGAASSGLSAESATRLFLIVLGILLGVWLLSLGLHWLWKRVSLYLYHQLHHTWCAAQAIASLSPVVRLLTPPNEENHARTCSLVFLFFIFSTFSITLLHCIVNETTLELIDIPVYFFLQSFRTHAFDLFFTVITLLISPYSIIMMMLTVLGFSIFLHNWRLLRYWLSICICCTLLMLGFNHYVTSPSIDITLLRSSYPLFPANNLLLATASLSFFMLEISSYSQNFLTKSIKLLITGLLIFSAIALLYLGDNWLSGVIAALSIGLCIALIHWIFYRRYARKINCMYALVIAFLCYLFAAATMITLNLQSSMTEHTPTPQQFVLTHEAWWGQKQPILPLYASNRLGRPVGLFNLQYLGSLQHVQRALEANGWEVYSYSFLQALLSKANASSSKQQRPLKTQFYLNQKPQLTMTYSKPYGKPLLVLSLWRSNFHLLNRHQPLWLGSIQPYHSSSKNKIPAPIPLNPLLAALRDFDTKTLSVTYDLLPGYNPTASLLIIQEKE
jgi:membrane protein DedA with SNARE-associated domain